MSISLSRALVMYIPTLKARQKTILMDGKREVAPRRVKVEQALKAGEAAFTKHLQEYARGQDVPIEAALWQHPANADTVELTVVSRRKSYIISLPATDLIDSHHGALRTEIMRLLLRAIKENIPMSRVWRNWNATEKRRAKGPTV